MPQFRFTAVDAGGVPKRGTIEASSEAEASARIANRGFMVRELAYVDGALPNPGAYPPRHESQSPETGDVDSETDQPSLRHATERMPQRVVAWAPLVLSIAAIALAFVALLTVLLHDPLGKGIGSYDFSTPESGAKSLIQIEANKDLRARLELQDLTEGGNSKEAARTFEINKVVDFGDKKVVFASYLRKGAKKKRILGFEKDLESKLWVPTYVSAYEVKDVNAQLAKEMEAWDKD